MPNTRNRINLNAQIDLLSDGQAAITSSAVQANKLIVQADEQRALSHGLCKTRLNMAGHRLDALDALLAMQEARVARVRAEVKTIRDNLQTI